MFWHTQKKSFFFEAAPFFLQKVAKTGSVLINYVCFVVMLLIKMKKPSTKKFYSAPKSAKIAIFSLGILSIFCFSCIYTAQASEKSGDIFSEYTGNELFISLNNGKPIVVELGHDSTVLNNEFLCSVLGSATRNNVEKIFIPSTVTRIEAKCFRDFQSLQTVILGINSKLETIGENAFEFCSQLKYISLERAIKLKTIGDKAFATCRELKSIIIPKNVENVGKHAFDQCENLESATFDRDSAIKTISQGIFFRCDSLKKVVLPQQLEKIDTSAFYSCESLESIEIPDTVTRIEISAFCNCTKLASIKLPSNLQTIGLWAFEGDTSLESLTIPKSVSQIGKAAFRSSGLKHIWFLSDLNDYVKIFTTKPTLTPGDVVEGCEITRADGTLLRFTSPTGWVVVEPNLQNALVVYDEAVANSYLNDDQAVRAYPGYQARQNHHEAPAYCYCDSSPYQTFKKESYQREASIRSFENYASFSSLNDHAFSRVEKHQQNFETLHNIQMPLFMESDFNFPSLNDHDFSSEINFRNCETLHNIQMPIFRESAFNFPSFNDHDFSLNWEAPTYCRVALAPIQISNDGGSGGNNDGFRPGESNMFGGTLVTVEKETSWLTMRNVLIGAGAVLCLSAAFIYWKRGPITFRSPENIPLPQLSEAGIAAVNQTSAQQAVAPSPTFGGNILKRGISIIRSLFSGN
jgi:hypothetical protein